MWNRFSSFLRFSFTPAVVTFLFKYYFEASGQICIHCMPTTSVIDIFIENKRDSSEDTLPRGVSLFAWACVFSSTFFRNRARVGDLEREFLRASRLINFRTGSNIRSSSFFLSSSLFASLLFIFAISTSPLFSLLFLPFQLILKVMT